MCNWEYLTLIHTLDIKQKVENQEDWVKYCYLEFAWTSCWWGVSVNIATTQNSAILQFYILPVVTVAPDDHISRSMLLQWYLLSQNSNMSHTQTDLDKNNITLAYSIPDFRTF
jgi:hypothetical protein